MHIRNLRTPDKSRLDSSQASFRHSLASLSDCFNRPWYMYGGLISPDLTLHDHLRISTLILEPECVLPKSGDDSMPNLLLLCHCSGHLMRTLSRFQLSIILHFPVHVRLSPRESQC
ncbi:hypothetical protein ACMFMF_006177 [Clarireedia jacksonii]